MEYYLIGVAAAFLVSIIRLYISISTASSQRIRNLKKVAGHYNITKGDLTEEKPSAFELIIYFLDLLIISPLLSWISVVHFFYALAKGHFNKANVPDRLKEISFKLATANLSKDQVKECLNELSRFYSGQDLDFRNPYDDDYEINTYVVSTAEDKNGWDVQLELNKENKTFTFNARDPDFCQHIDVYEYKFESTDLYARAIESKHKYPTHTEYEIKNGVVQEDEYREANKDMMGGEELENRIAKLNKSLEWAKFNNPAAHYFLLFRHADVIDDAEARRFFQMEYERITSGLKKLKEQAEKLGGVIKKADNMPWYTVFSKSPDMPEEDCRKLSALIEEENLIKYNLRFSEFQNQEQLTSDLSRYLAKLQA